MKQLMVGGRVCSGDGKKKGGHGGEFVAETAREGGR